MEIPGVIVKTDDGYSVSIWLKSGAVVLLVDLLCGFCLILG